jgi:plastocyanin
MRDIKLMVALLVLLPFTLSVHADEMKQDAAPTASQEMKQDTTQAAPEAKPETKPEAKGEAQPAMIDHGIKEKRFVATAGADGVQHVEITGGEYYFDPNYIVVKVNVPVELSVKKATGYVPHNIAVNAPEAGIGFKVDLSDKDKTVKFTPTKVGKYEMMCDKKLLWFKSHKDRGMDGFIEVIP